MACIIVPLTEAIITTVAAKALKAKEREHEAIPFKKGNSIADANVKIPFSRKLKWLSNMLWGGSLLLAFEHVWHGEVVPWYPFLTAVSNPADKTAMLQEMATVGVLMACTVTAVWAAMLLVVYALEKKILKAQHAAN